MWFIFIISCIAVALAALGVIYVGHKIIQKIESDERKAEIEEETYLHAKQMIKDKLEKESNK